MHIISVYLFNNLCRAVSVQNSRQCCWAVRSAIWRAAAAVAVNRGGFARREETHRTLDYVIKSRTSPLWSDSPPVKKRRRGAGTMRPRCACALAALSARRCKRQRVRILRQLWSGITGLGKLSEAWKSTLITEQIINQTVIRSRVHCVRPRRSVVRSITTEETQSIWMRTSARGASDSVVSALLRSTLLRRPYSQVSINIQVYHAARRLGAKWIESASAELMWLLCCSVNLCVWFLICRENAVQHKTKKIARDHNLDSLL